MPSTSSPLPRGMIPLLAAASALGPVATQILLPAIPVLREYFGVEPYLAQLTLSLSMLSIAVSNLIYGPLADRYGRKPVLLGGIALTIIASIACVLAPTVEWLIAARIVQAAGSAVGLVVARAIVRDAYSASQAAGIISTLVMFMVVLPMLSPAVGGELTVRFGWRSVFYAVGALSLVLLVAIMVRLPETLRERTSSARLPDMLRGFLQLLRSRVFCGYAFTLAFVSVMFFSFIAAAPEIMVSVLNRPPTEYGYYFIMIPAGFMAGNYLIRYLGERLDTHRLIRAGTQLGIAGVLIALMLQLLGLQHPLALFLPVTLSTFGNGLSLPSAQAGAINEFPDLAGSASGLTGFLQMGFSALAAQLVAWIFNGTVYPMLFLMLAAAILAMACFLVNVPPPADSEWTE